MKASNIFLVVVGLVCVCMSVWCGGMAADLFDGAFLFEDVAFMFVTAFMLVVTLSPVLWAFNHFNGIDIMIK